MLMTVNHPVAESLQAKSFSIPEESLRSLLDSAPDAVARFDRELRHVYVNEATARANSLPAPDFIGKTMRELGHTEFVSELIETNLKAVFESGETRTFDVDFSGPHGRALYQCRMAPEMDQTGEIRYVIVISRNLTEEREAERELREAQELEAANKLANELAHQLNNPLQGLRNTVFLLQRGAKDERTAELLHETDELLSRMTAIVDAILLLREHKATSNEEFARMIEGTRSLYEAARHVVAIAESSKYSMISVDLEGVITSWNRAATALYGYRAEDVIGKSLASITAPGREHEIKGALENVKRGIPVEPYDAVRTTQSGRDVRVRLYLSPIYGPQNRVVGVSSIGVALADDSKTGVPA
jgi:PAS domain S-box-containing protein